jgi:hypothetical protein
LKEYGAAIVAQSRILPSLLCFVVDLYKIITLELRLAIEAILF